METGQLIVAIRNTTCHLLQEAEEEPGTVGKPPIMDMEISGWCFQIVGNPDVVADWLKGHGFHAAMAVKSTDHNKCFLYPETITLVDVQFPSETDDDDDDEEEGTP